MRTASWLDKLVCHIVGKLPFQRQNSFLKDCEAAAGNLSNEARMSVQVLFFLSILSDRKYGILCFADGELKKSIRKVADILQSAKKLTKSERKVWLQLAEKTAKVAKGFIKAAGDEESEENEGLLLLEAAINQTVSAVALGMAECEKSGEGNICPVCALMAAAKVVRIAALNDTKEDKAASAAEETLYNDAAAKLLELLREAQKTAAPKA